MSDPMIIRDDIDFAAYELETDAKRNVKPVQAWVDELIHRLRNPDRSPKVHLPWEKARDVFHFRPGEVTLWAGQNGHGKTGLVSQIMLSLIGQEQKICIASLEMKPLTTLALMARMYAGTNPYSEEYQQGSGVDALAEIYDEFKGWVAVECRETQHESIKCRSIENLDVGPRETFRVPIADLPSNGVFAVWVGDGQPSGQLQYSVETKRPYPFQKSAPETSK